MAKYSQYFDRKKVNHLIIYKIILICNKYDTISGQFIQNVTKLSMSYISRKVAKLQD